MSLLLIRQIRLVPLSKARVMVVISMYEFPYLLTVCDGTLTMIDVLLTWTVWVRGGCRDPVLVCRSANSSGK